MAGTETAPRTFRELFVQVEALGGEVIGIGDRLFEIRVPRRFRNCGTQEIETHLVNIARVGWFVRDGKNHLRGDLAAIRRAIANLAEGKDPLRPRRDTVTGCHAGRDRQGRFTS